MAPKVVPLKNDQSGGTRSYQGMPRLPQDHSGATSDQHLVYLWLLGRVDSTAKSYRADAMAFLKAVRKPLPELTASDVAIWVESLEGGDNYRARRLISIKSLLSFAKKTGYCVFDVGSVIRLQKTKNRLHERLIEPGTVKSMTAAATMGRDRILMRLIYSSAARVSEAVGLNFGDLGKGVVTLFGKGKKTRTVTCAQEVIDEMMALRRPGDDKDSPVFKNCHGRRLSVRAVQRMVAKCRTDVPGVSPHWMRHAHATHSLDNGALLHKLQHQLGHENISTTNIYVHVRAGQGTADYVPL
jgi:integrase/recombinase XerD